MKTLNWLLISLFLCISVQSACRAATDKHVLILNSYHRGYLWSDNITESAINLLNDRFESIEIYVEYMDTKRLYSEQSLNLLKQNLILKYKDIKLDAIISSDDNALSFLMRNKDGLFPGVPVVFCGINNLNRAIELKDNPEYTGIVEVLEIKPTIDAALKLCPGTKKIMMVSDSTPTAMGARREMRAIHKDYSDIEFVYLNGEDLTTDELIAVLQETQPGTIVICFVWFRDKSGRYFSLEHVGSHIVQSCAVPFFALNDFWMNYGAIGGKLNSGNAHGTEAADIASKIIAGTHKPTDIPIEKCRLNNYIFDWEQLCKWNFDLSLLPEGSIIINRNLSFFQRNKKLVISALTFIIFQSLIIFGFIANLIWRKKVEREKSFSETRYQDLVESVNDWVWEVDADLKFTFSSPTVERILGYKPEEIIGKTPFDLIIPEEHKRISDYAEQKIREKKSFNMLENICTHKNGAKVVIETSGTPIFDDKNNLIGFRGVDRDISEKKKAEKEREKLLKDLSVKNEELENIVYIASHDLRSPLVNIQGFSNEIKQTIDDVFKKINASNISPTEKEEMRKLYNSFIDTSFGFIRKNVSKMDQLLSSLLKLARLGSSATEIKVIDMNELIDSIFSSMSYQIKNAKIKVETQPLPDCVGDYTQVNQVFSNIIDNAIKYIDSKKPGEIKVYATTYKDKIVYCIEDNGIGIDPLYHKKVFEIFQRLNPNDNLDGIGIGLTIVKRILDRNNGNIWIESKPDEGCKVFVELPVAGNDSYSSI